MRANLSCCLGLIDKGQDKSKKRLLVLALFERSHGKLQYPDASGPLGPQPCYPACAYIKTHNLEPPSLLPQGLH